MKKKLYIQTLFNKEVLLETPIENYENYKIYKETKRDMPVSGFINNEALRVVFK